jgi:hypothetical protein
MKSLSRFLMLAILLATLALVGCEGDDGANGAPGADGVSSYQAAVDAGYIDPAVVSEEDYYAALGDASAPEATKVEAESCAVCHAGVGEMHQAVYDDAYDYTIDLAIDSVSSVGAGPYNTTVDFTLTQNGLPYVDADALPSMNRWYGYALMYNAAAGISEYDVLGSFSQSNIVSNGDGTYSVTATGLTSDVVTSDAGIWLEVAQGPIDLDYGPHVQLYSEVATDGMAFGAMATTVESSANASGCARCHGEPYGKHGYRVAQAGNLPEFAPCAACHFAGREGGHVEWQLSQDDPEFWSGATTVQKPGIDYSYEATAMGDTHISHAMELPYPQSMANCIVCHDGKLDMILTDATFTLKTCKTCHWEEGAVKEGVYDTTGLALATIIPHSWTPATVCADCHNGGAQGIAPVFSEIHPGYDTSIYASYDNATATGVKYSDVVTVAIDSASFDAATNTMSATAKVTSTNAAIVDPADVELHYAMWGLYAYDSDDLLTSRNNGTTAADGAWKTVNADGSVDWDVTYDFSGYADEIAAGDVNRAKLSFYADYFGADGGAKPVNSANETVVLADSSFGDKVDFVRVDTGCNVCHEAMGLTFHSFTYGSNDIETCKTCHVATSGGSHLEMQSRSIDSYVHAIHSFQAFDHESIDFTEPFEAKHYEIHTEEFFYPLFTTLACESCHNDGTYNVPNQQVSLAERLSSSEDNDSPGYTRNIGTVPAAIVGPAASACGGCHRAMLIKEDDAGGLAAFNAHAKQFGYRIEDTSTQLTVWETIQSLFD